MSQEISVAVIGAGYWGKNYVRILNGLYQVAKIGYLKVCDSSETCINNIKRLYPGVETTRDVDEIYGDSSIKAVFVITQATTHFEIVTKCLLSNKHVMVEKPLTMDSTSSAKLVALADERKLILMVGHLFIFNPGVEALKNVCEEHDKFGKVHYMHAIRTNLGPIREDANCLWDLATHDVSIILHLMNGQLPAFISATGCNVLPNSEQYDVGFVTMYYPEKNVIAHIHASWLEPHKVREFVVVGSKRRVCFNDMEPRTPITIYEKGVMSAMDEFTDGIRNPDTINTLTVRDGDIIIPKIESAEPLSAQVNHFLSCIKTNTTPRTTGRDGLAVVRILEAACKSLESGGKQVFLDNHSPLIMPSSSESTRAIVFIGNGTQGVEALNVVLTMDCFIVKLVICDSCDNGEDSWRKSLLKFAKNKLPSDVVLTGNPNKLIDQIRSVAPDYILSVQCRSILKFDLLSIPRKLTMNLHNAPLPLLRGCDPFAWAIHDGLTRMGVSLHAITDEGVDSGPIISQLFWPITQSSSAFDLYKESIVIGTKLLSEALPLVVNGNLNPRPQEDAMVSYHPMGQFPFSRGINVDLFDQVASTLSANIRSRIFPPFQTPYMYVDGVKINILEVEVGDNKSSALNPGTICSLDPLEIVTKFGGSIKLLKLSKSGDTQLVDLVKQFNLSVGINILKHSSKVPLVDAAESYKSHKDEIDANFYETLRTGRFVGGPMVDKFERDFANFIGAKHCISVNSGTDALMLVYKMLGLAEGDEVITQANTFVATVLGASNLGAKVILVDCCKDTHMMDVSKLEQHITNRTKLIVPVHLHGHAANLKAIHDIASKFKGMHVVEDTCQAHGAKYKDGEYIHRVGDCTFSIASCFSFYPGKNLGAFGDGGAICTNNDELAFKLKTWRSWGSNKKYHHDLKGGNSRLDSLQAGVLSAKLTKLDEQNAKRRFIAESVYMRRLSKLPNIQLPRVPEG